MTLEDGSVKPNSRIADASALGNDAADAGTDNFADIRLPMKQPAPSPKSENYNTGEGVITAAASGAVVGMASPLYGNLMREGAASALQHGLSGFPLAMDGPFSKVGSWLDKTVIRSGIDDQKSILEGFRTMLNPTDREAFALRTRGALAQADGALYEGLARTAHSPWVPETSMLKAARNGAAVGLTDWAVDRGLEWATGAQTFRPNIIESSLVTGMAMSPIPGRYKVGAIATAWGVGKLSNIIGLT